ncbi:CsbD family protein [Saccharibacillus alkalitolerans]|uniref:CsbD family protein n=1 Tax=Saccharibacillus alkalitolerans TaxID=2705290 RepID=A0ABX0FDF1_9BACL|nr:CsbD family protein [Saccharibacillus alkalitolerans]NGZ76272.1 CsbD family protein [Saccharibacillus alkalitolerans]
MADNGLSDKIKGGVNKAKGEIKDQVGNAKNDPSMQAEGKMDKAKGEVQDKIGDLKDRH